MKDICFWR